MAKGYMDMRIWSLSLLEGVGDYIFVEVKFKPICMDGKGYFTLCYNEPDLAQTSSESTGGWIYKVTKKDDKVVVINRGSRVIATLEEGKEYTLAAGFPVGERTYDFFVDGVRVSQDNKWVGPVNGLCGFRIDTAGLDWSDTAGIAANPLEWEMDDLIITYGNELDKKEYFATPTPTPEPTPTPTATPEATAAPETTEAPNPSDEPKGNGCGGMIVSSAVVTAVTLMGAAMLLGKKEE